MLKDTLKPWIEPLKTRKVTNRYVAQVLGVSEVHLCRTLKALGVEKEPVESRQQQKELNAERRRHRKHLAKTLPPAEAAKAANCSIRTIYRYR